MNNIPLEITATETMEWAPEIVLAFLLTWVLYHLIRKFFDKIQSESLPHFRSLTILIPAARMPSLVLIWIMGIRVTLEIFRTQFPSPFVLSLMLLCSTSIIIVICWFLMRLKTLYFADLRMRVLPEDVPKVNAGTLDLVEKISAVIIVISGALVLMPTYGFSINGLLAFGGVGGIVLGLATKDILSNMFGAISIHIDRPFNIGEWISLPEKNLQGTVERIGWRQTVVRTFEKRLVYIPNSLFGTIIIENPSRMTHRRITETIRLRYEDNDKITFLTNDIRHYLATHPAIDDKTGVVVYFSTYNSYSLDIAVSAFTQITSWNEFTVLKEEILLKIGDIIRSYDAEIAMPPRMG